MYTFVSTLLLFALSVAAWADSWPNAGSRVFAETTGGRGFKVIPISAAAGTHAGEVQSRGVLFYLENDGTEKVLWDKLLVNIPVGVLVSSRGNCVVTLDTWAHMSYEHGLVVYGAKGEVVADFKLEDLLSKDEIQKNVDQSVSSRNWLRDANTRFDETAEHLVITLKWGKLITLDLKTGKIV